MYASNYYYIKFSIELKLCTAIYTATQNNYRAKWFIAKHVFVAF